jgi:hypothetical protein
MERQAEITDEFIRNRIAKGKQYCARLFKAGPNRDQPPDEDPAVKAGRLVYEIYHWFGIPGECLPE